jgi:hypothetical protein
MTVWIYVDTSKQVGDRDHLKVFARRSLPILGSRKTTRRALRSSMTFWNEPKSAPERPAGPLARLPDLSTAAAEHRQRSHGIGSTSTMPPRRPTSHVNRRCR